jgi:acetylornithine deacetylase/succinyl-diaminopimelate desuccinylase-like protein
VTTTKSTIPIDEQRLVGLVSDLVNIPSVTGSEREVADFVLGYLKDVGLEARQQEVEDGRVNVIGRLRGTGGGKAIAFTGHLDTATSGRPEEDHAGLGELGPGHYPRAYVKDGHVYGLGAFNMKGGVAAAITAAATLAHTKAALRGDVLVIWVCGESENAPVDGLHRQFRGARYRGGGVGTRYYITHGQVPDYVVVCEPSNLFVANADAGYLFVKLVLNAPGGGAAANRGGAKAAGPVSGAVSIMTDVVGAIEAWKPQYAKKHAYPTGLGTMEPAVGIGAVESGWPFKPTYRPPVANIYLTLRLTPAMDANTPLIELRTVLDELSKRKTDFEYDIEVYGSNYPSTIIAADHPLVSTALAVRERVLGAPQGIVPSLYYGTWNDTNIFRQHGVPAMILGPSWDENDPNAKSYDVGQHVSIAQLNAAAQIYMQIAKELCA